MKIWDRAVLALVRYWCFLRHPRLCKRVLLYDGVLPDAARPASYVDKFLWRRIFDHNPVFTTACDKLAAREYALSTCPGLKAAKVLWCGDDLTLMPEELLAGNVVVKANHGSGWNIFVHNGEVDRATLRQTASNWLQSDYSTRMGEWGYRNASHRILIEEMLLEDGQPVRDIYKFWVVNGRTQFVYASRRSEMGRNLHCHLESDGRICPPTADADATWIDIDPPATFHRMREMADELAAEFDLMRCDFYEVGGEIFFSELTVYPMGGAKMTYKRLADQCNAAWDLRRSWFLTEPQTGWRSWYAAALRRWLDERLVPARR